MLHVLWSIIVGFFVGLIARHFVQGVEVVGFWMTALLGIAGSIAGGLLARLFSRPAEGAKFHPAGLLVSIIGAILLLVVWKAMHS